MSLLWTLILNIAIIIIIFINVNCPGYFYISLFSVKKKITKKRNNGELGEIIYFCEFKHFELLFLFFYTSKTNFKLSRIFFYIKKLFSQINIYSEKKFNLIKENNFWTKKNYCEEFYRLELKRNIFSSSKINLKIFLLKLRQCNSLKLFS